MSDTILFSSTPTRDIKSFLEKKSYSKVCVLVDENTEKYCYPLIKDALPEHKVISVHSGEEHKNLRTCEIIWQVMTEQHLDRHSVLLVLGGGVLGDMGGFCAATYKRGIDFILIPTTLLAQVDASIGGKLGIDFNYYKNHIGVFQIPALTLLYSGFLKTLPFPEKRSGFAEIVKHILTSDLSLWNAIKEKSLETQDWDILIKHSVQFKAKVVQEDPREAGLRKILNAGHTIGHAIESYLLHANRKIMHGEAVAAGLIAEGFIATQRNLLEKGALDEITKYVVSVFGKVDFTVEEENNIAHLTLQDKKNKGNKVLSVLLNGIGNAQWDYEISLEEIQKALSFYRSIKV